MYVTTVTDSIPLSIHDLTRRSTQLRTGRGSGRKSFNSRPHEEVDTAPSPMRTAPIVFQFTTSRGGRQYHNRNARYNGLFQFTTSRGGRRTSLCRDSEQIAFQFTTSRGGRQSIGRAEGLGRSFNSRPHEEVDMIVLM